MMFDDKKLNIWSYSLESLLAEKLETVIARSTLNTRMRDFYDIHILWSEKADEINCETLRRAIINVAQKRGTYDLLNKTDEILSDISESEYLHKNWDNYKKSSYYVGELQWTTVLDTTLFIFKNELGSNSII